MRNPNRYAAILRIRERAEDREAQALAAIRAEIQRAHRERTSLELARQLTLDQAGISLRDQFDASDIRGYYQYERHVVHLRDQKDAEIRQLEARESAQRAVLEYATRERRVAERLHQRRREAYHQYIRQVEQKILDEIATMYAARPNLNSAPASDEGSKQP